MHPCLCDVPDAEPGIHQCIQSLQKRKIVEIVTQPRLSTNRIFPFKKPRPFQVLKAGLILQIVPIMVGLTMK